MTVNHGCDVSPPSGRKLSALPARRVGAILKQVQVTPAVPALDSRGPRPGGAHNAAMRQAEVNPC
jgi:hypothetical protein